MIKISAPPNAKQRAFYQKKLIPAILREQGKTFAMDHWYLDTADYDYDGFLDSDGIIHDLPKTCGSVCCIGGTAQVQAGIKSPNNDWDDNVITKIAKILGLTPLEARALFFNWATHDPEENNNVSYNGLGWPVQYAKDFSDAQTPLDKAKVAVKLLREIVKKGGIVLYYNKLEAK